MSFKTFLWGEIPAGWKVKKLDELSEYISRGKQPKYVEHSEIRTLNQKSIRWYELQEENFKYQNPDINVAKKHYIKENDVVLNSTGVGTVGRAYHFDYQPSNLFADSHVTIIRTKNDELNSRFLMYQLATDEYQSFIESSYLAGSTGQVEFNKSKVMELLVLVPPADEQEHIVSKLYKIDKKIEINNQINKNLEEMAQAIFKHWFVDFEFPNEEGKPYKSSGGEMVESELGLIPKGWEVKNLVDILDIKYGKNLPKTKLLEKGYPVFGGNGIIGYYSDYLYKKSQVIVACRGAASGKVLTSLPFSFITNNSLVLENNKEILPYEYLKQFCFANEFYGYATGSAQPQITITNLSKAKILVPSAETLSKYSETIKSSDEYLLKIQDENHALMKIRDTLLPKLMSGEIRVPLESESDAS